MKRVVACVFCAGSLIAAETADARGMGRFVGGLVTRGAVSGVTRGMQKSYTPEILTVDQLVQCLKQASTLDQESERLELARKELQISSHQIDQLKAQLEKKGSVVNRSSREAVDNFNAEIDRYNALETNVRSRQNVFNSSANVHNISATSYNAS